MNIRIDESAELRVLALAHFADNHGCELVSRDGEILIRAKKKKYVDNIATISSSDFDGGRFHQYMVGLL